MSEYSIGEIGERPWGMWEVLTVGSKYIVKRITVHPGQRLSLQRHQHRSETWTVAQGVATVECDQVVSECGIGECICIPQGCVHRLSNKTEVPVIIVEIQVGDILDEEDIERFEDDYCR